MPWPKMANRFRKTEKPTLTWIREIALVLWWCLKVIRNKGTGQEVFQRNIYKKKSGKGAAFLGEAKCTRGHPKSWCSQLWQRDGQALQGRGKDQM